MTVARLVSQADKDGSVHRSWKRRGRRATAGRRAARHRVCNKWSEMNPAPRIPELAEHVKRGMGAAAAVRVPVCRRAKPACGPTRCCSHLSAWKSRVDPGQPVDGVVLLCAATRTRRDVMGAGAATSRVVVSGGPADRQVLRCGDRQQSSGSSARGQTGPDPAAFMERRRDVAFGRQLRRMDGATMAS